MSANTLAHIVPQYQSQIVGLTPFTPENLWSHFTDIFTSGVSMSYLMNLNQGVSSHIMVNIDSDLGD